MQSDTSFTNLESIGKKIKTDQKIIEKKWIKRDRVQKVFQPYAIHPVLFIKHFGSRVIDYMISVIDGENKAGNCPVIHIMLDYFSDKNIELGDIHLICSELKNVLLLYYIENTQDFNEAAYFEIADLLDSNFKGVIDEYFSKQCTKCVVSLENQNTNVNVEKVINKNRLADIRFNQNNKTTAVEFMSSLDPTITDKVENFVEQLDDFNALLYDLEQMSGDDSLHQIQLINQILLDFYYSIDSMSVFPIMVRTFNQLIEFLNTLTSEQLNNQEKRLLLANMLTGLGIDLENWIKSIFEEQVTDDIHYFDASFANNCMEMEAIFCEENIATQEDDLEFF